MAMIFSIPEHLFDPVLLRRTGRFCEALDVRAEVRGTHVEPSHLLIMLARHRPGLAASMFDERSITVGAFASAIARLGTRDGPDSPSPRRSVPALEALASAATRAVFTRLGGSDEPDGDGATTDAPPGPPVPRVAPPLDERRLLTALLPELEPAAVDLLERYGRVDIGRWLRDLTGPEADPVALFGPKDRLDVSMLTPGARHVLAVLVAEAAGLGAPVADVALLLYAMLSTSGGLLERGLFFIGQDVAVVRAKALALTGGGTGRSVPPWALAEQPLDARLRDAMRLAARFAADRGSAAVAERDLLAALLEAPDGLAASFFRDLGVDLVRLTTYAERYYREHGSAASGRAVMPAPPLAGALRILRERLVGQDSVVDRLAHHIERIKRGTARGFRVDERARAVLLFCGPSGTGKTMTARLLAEILYGSADALVVFEMGQFATPESVNTLIGAPLGFAGFGGGRLTNELRDDPRRVFLFDEAEKAHPMVLDVLLRLLDDGQITDPAGPVRDASESLIVFTSGTGDVGSPDAAPFPAGPPAAPQHGLSLPQADPEVTVEQWLDSVLPPGTGATGPGTADAGLRRGLANQFRPEFLNRLDDVLLFAPLGPTELRTLADRSLRALADRIRDQLGVRLAWEPAAADWIGTTAWRYRPNEAARGVNRCTSAVVPDLLRALDEADRRGQSVRRLTLREDNGRLTVSVDGDGDEPPDDRASQRT